MRERAHFKLCFYGIVLRKGTSSSCASFSFLGKNGSLVKLPHVGYDVMGMGRSVTFEIWGMCTELFLLRKTT